MWSRGLDLTCTPMLALKTSITCAWSGLHKSNTGNKWLGPWICHYAHLVSFHLARIQVEKLEAADMGNGGLGSSECSHESTWQNACHVNMQTCEFCVLCNQGTLFCLCMHRGKANVGIREKSGSMPKAWRCSLLPNPVSLTDSLASLPRSLAKRIGERILGAADYSVEIIP